MGIFSKKNGGFMDEIRCDEPSYLIWKWHPKGSQKGGNDRENSIRWGSSLRVKEGEVAVFVYKQKDGTIQDFIEGPFDSILKTDNLPVIASLIGLAYDGGTPFQAEVYFINIAKIIQVKFAVPYFDVYDPRYDDFGVPTSIRGTISFQISNYREFIKLHRLVDFDLDSFQNQVKDVVIRYVKDIVTNAPAVNNISLLQIETKISEINDRVELDIKERLKEDFGITISGVDISAIELDKSSDEYKQLLDITKNVTSATIKAETEAKVKNIADKQKVDIENYEENLRIQREEGQYAIHKQTQSSNMEAFKIESQRDVGMAGAEALGKMGENNSGSVDLGTGGTGFNPAAMMAGMAVGGAVGQNIAGTMKDIMSNTSETTPPPVPKTKYYIADNGQQTGPFEIDTIRRYIQENKLKKEDLIWKSGLKDWIPAYDLEEIKKIFDDEIPPVISQ